MAEKTKKKKSEHLYLFNFKVQSSTNTESVVTEKAIEEDSYTEEDEKRAWLFEQIREKVITRSLCYDMAGLLLLEDNIEKNDKLLTQLYHALFDCQTRKNNMRCKTRFCLSCAKRRSAELIQKYQPVIDTWKYPQFVTLTVPAVYVDELKETISKMFHEFSKMISLLNKKYKARGLRYLGLKFFECDFNAEEQFYTPHFHLIIENKIAAKQIIFQWQKRFPVSADAQQMKPVEEGTSARIIAYASKYFANKKINVSSSTDDVPVIHLKAYLNIFKAMELHKQFFRFGFDMSNKPKPKKSRSDPAYKRERLVFDMESNGLFNADTGKKVIAFNKIPYDLKRLLVNTDIDLS